MTKLTQALSIVALASFAAAPSAFAGETSNASMTAVSTEATTFMSAVDTKMIALPAQTEPQVLGAVDETDLIAVEGPDGRIYYNRIIPVAELPDPELDLRVVETFDVEHEGEVFTNKIVEMLN